MINLLEGHILDVICFYGQLLIIETCNWASYYPTKIGFEFARNRKKKFYMAFHLQTDFREKDEKMAKLSYPIALNKQTEVKKSSSSKG